MVVFATTGATEAGKAASKLLLGSASCINQRVAAWCGAESERKRHEAEEAVAQLLQHEEATQRVLRSLMEEHQRLRVRRAVLTGTCWRRVLGPPVFFLRCLIVAACARRHTPPKMPSFGNCRAAARIRLGSGRGSGKRTSATWRTLPLVKQWTPLRP